MPGVPGDRLVELVLRPERHRELGDDEQEEARDAQALGQQQPQQPADLDDRRADCIAQCVAAARLVLDGDPQPLGDQGHPHDDVAKGHRRELAVLDRTLHAGREDEDAGDLQEGEQAVRDVVGVVRGGEPGEAHPGPPDREERHRVAQDPVREVVLDDLVVQGACGGGNGHDEAQVEEQLERGARSVWLGAAAGHHRPDEGWVLPERRDVGHAGSS